MNNEIKNDTSDVTEMKDNMELTVATEHNNGNDEVTERKVDFVDTENSIANENSSILNKTSEKK